MITLLTGLPGAGKTLFALWHIKKYSESENRPVFYSGITDLQLPWTLFKPEEWHSLPAGAIIVIDECQTVFPKKPNGAKLPEFYEKLAVHRHKGFDIFLITQHPSLLDNFARQLVGRHFHAVRKFGMQRSTIYEWSAANSTPQSLPAQKSAIPLKWSYPKEVFTYYKSAEVHTVKRSIPAKLILAVLFVFAVFGIGYWSLDHFQNRGKVDAIASVPASGIASGIASVSRGVNGELQSPLQDAARYVFVNTPRVAGLPHTAPKYDEITKPVRAPVPAMCIATVKKCRCFSQQATPMSISFEMCSDFAKHGYFLDFDPESRQRDSALAGRSVDLVQDRALAASSQAVLISHDPKAYDVSSYK